MKRKLLILLSVMLISLLVGCGNTSFPDKQILDRIEFHKAAYNRIYKSNSAYKVANIIFGKKSDYSFSDESGYSVDREKTGNIKLFVEKTNHSVYKGTFYNVYILSNDVIALDEDCVGIFEGYDFVENMYISNVNVDNAKSAGITTADLFIINRTHRPDRIVAKKNEWKLSISEIKNEGTVVEFN